MALKKTVHYDLDEVKIILAGRPALVHCIDHPSDLVSNEGLCETSKVVVIFEGGFETLNTRYIGAYREEL